MSRLLASKSGQTPLVVTMGDPAGIGPEIVLSAIRQRPTLVKQVVVACDIPTLHRASALLGAQDGRPVPKMVELGEQDDWSSASVDGLCLVQASAPHEPVPFGRVSGTAGRAAAQCIAEAARWTLQGRTCAMVTAPVHKEALAMAGIAHPGHTEFLQALAAEHSGVGINQMPVRMMLSAPGLSTVLVSIHVSMKQALDAITFEQVLQTIRITAAHFSRCGMPKARIAVAGLNPHAGEGGLFGREELDVIVPAIEQARSEGLVVSGAHPPDTVFMRARQGEFDVVIAMYHDQGLIPVKLLGLEHGVNTTLGLPLIRTSPDHGTAFDLAGTGKADPSSLLAAIDAALLMVSPRKKEKAS
jgi:4-hydroxythreonine-4-phosphate dehydrogenase